jgi:hypothetical protein
MPYIPAHLVFRNYIPSELKEGMLFCSERSIRHLGGEQMYLHLYEMNEIPLDSDYYDEFYAEHGFPVHVEIYAQIEDNPDSELVLVAKEENIGWVEQENQLYEFTIEDMNAVMLHYNGMLGIYMEEDEITNLLVPAMEDDLVVVTWMDNIYQEYDDDEEEEY